MKALGYKQKGKNSQQGVTLLLAILVLSSILAISFSLATILLVEVSSSGDLLRTEASLYGATGVGEQALFDLKRGACTSNDPGCYTSQFGNNVILSSSPSLVTNANPIFTDKVTTGTTLSNTPNKYDFCDVSGGTTGCGFSKVTVNYIITNQSSDGLLVYLCQWDPNAAPHTYQDLPPCSQTGASEGYWLGPSGGTTQGSDGSAAMSPTINSVSWTLNSALQQELIFVNAGQNNIYFSVATFGSDGVTPKGLPYVGKTAVDVSTANGEVGRTIQVVAPNLSNASSLTTQTQTVSEGGTASLTCSSGTIKSFTSLYGSNCTGGSYTCPQSCGSCTVGSSSCSVTYNNTLCGDCAFGCAKNGDLAISCGP